MVTTRKTQSSVASVHAEHSSAMLCSVYIVKRYGVLIDVMVADVGAWLVCVRVVSRITLVLHHVHWEDHHRVRKNERIHNNRECVIRERS